MTSVSESSVADPRGSLWRRWDPHIHAPGTALSDQFGGDMDGYLAAIETATPAPVALGITDYFGTRTYEAVLAEKAKGRLPNVELLFPNVELRLAIGTKAGSGINLHLLVSPHQADHVDRIRRFLAKLTFEYSGEPYHCAFDDLVQLGRAHDPSTTVDEAAHSAGVNQFKVDYRQLKDELSNSTWAQENVLVALAAGSTDGSSGLQDDQASFAAQRKEIEAASHIIFSGSPKQTEFWLGRGDALSVQDIERIYNGLKPCLQGSDAHRLEKVLAPELDRRCWIKGDPTFDALRHACLEPASRVHIGPHPPDAVTANAVVANVATADVPWLLDDGIELNRGLIAVIGARGSGKTALADLVAHGAGSSGPLRSKDSFLRRAHPFLSNGTVKLQWINGRRVERNLAEVESDDDPDVHYLSQQFVERLCSAEGPNDELTAEIEKVVFESHDPLERLGTTTFKELLLQRTGDTKLQRQYLRDRLDRISEAVQIERRARAGLPAKEAARKTAVVALATDFRTRQGIVGKGQKERAEYYERLRVAIDERNGQVQSLDRRLQSVTHLAAEAKRYRDDVFVDLHQQLRQQHGSVGLTDEAWSHFEIGFKGDVGARIRARAAELRKQLDDTKAGSLVSAATQESTAEELSKLPLSSLTVAFAEVSKAIGVDQQNQRKLQVLNERIARTKLEIEKLDEEIKHDQGSESRERQLFAERTAAYSQFFALVVQEAEALRNLYQPLKQKLSSGSPSVQRLRLEVVRHVDVAGWAARGEELLDLRKTGAFKGRGALAEFAEHRLGEAWRRGTPDEVAAAMAEFRAKYDTAILAQSKADRGSAEYPQWVIDIGRWLYSTDHIQVTYSFMYEDTPLAQLSPGTRGIVLLLLYLALDVDDSRPLIIDQPEENLDPRSVFTELVELFRTARQRRQVIIVTHNANLVVNTDVDQVIVATATRTAAGRPPTIRYASGGIENAAIRSSVCEILEGGEAAFRERAKRLRLLM